jgi:murein DD-endopeptidase MepM/ murein hydrolase activator NlpD
MPLKHGIAGIGAALLFAVGVATAFADSPPATTDTTTTTTWTTTTEETTTEAPTTTTTSPPPTTTTTTTTTPTVRGATPTPPRPKASAPRGLGDRPEVTAQSRKEARPSARRHKKRHRVSRPLKVTPPLGQRDFVFPVVGVSDYIDTYGEFRSDVHGKWHHGDDIFAPLGAPVVAVASGTINRIGWRKAGGWRLWVRDSAADEFYYAHLSGYARSVFHSKRVRAGQVIGFVGNTGDAFPRAPHLHFEIHPRQLLRLRYDGAVDPTTYLDSWTHLQGVAAARPVHPRLPRLRRFRREARYVFRQLLAARHLLEQQLEQRERPSIPVLGGVNGPSLAQRLPFGEPVPTGGSQEQSSTLTAALLGGFALAGLFWTSLLLARLRRRRRRAAVHSALP